MLKMFSSNSSINIGNRTQIILKYNEFLKIAIKGDFRPISRKIVNILRFEIL